jgi:hypothetical protein
MLAQVVMTPAESKKLIAKADASLDAVEILSGSTAVPLAAGGLGGAEGAVTLARSHIAGFP